MRTTYLNESLALEAVRHRARSLVAQQMAHPPPRLAADVRTQPTAHAPHQVHLRTRNATTALTP